MLGLKFAYATNGAGIVEVDYTTGVERSITEFPTPDELWRRLQAAENLDDETAEKLLTPAYPDRTTPLRYYQEIAVQRAVQAVLQGRRRMLLTLCTGAGKTAIAFQICWKLWSGALDRQAHPPAAENPLSVRPQLPGGRSHGQGLQPVRRGAAQNHRRASHHQPRHVLRHLPGHRRRREPARPVPRIPARLLRSGRRRRVPPWQRPRRQQLARHPGMVSRRPCRSA